MTAAAEEAGPEGSRYAEIRRVTLVGAVVNFVVAVVKLVVGVTGQSQALIADGIHSAADLLTDFLVLFAAKHGSREPDEDHPYGHGRIETLATLVLGGALVATGLGIGWDAVTRLRNPEQLLTPGLSALAVAFVSIFAKEWVYQYTIALARRLRSSMLEANAWHSRSDAVASIVAVAGIGGSMLGYGYLDALAALGVAFMIAKIGWELAAHGAHELIDTALAAEQVEAIRQSILAVDGVRAVHQLRTRQMAGGALVDVHVLVDPELSVSEGHYISDTVYARAVKEVDGIRDMLVHIDPEDDEASPRPSPITLPGRGELSRRLNEAWAAIPEAGQSRRMTLHYLRGGVAVEILLPLECAPDPERGRALAEALRAAATAVEEVRTVAVVFG